MPPKNRNTASELPASGTQKAPGAQHVPPSRPTEHPTLPPPSGSAPSESSAEHEDVTPEPVPLQAPVDVSVDETQHDLPSDADTSTVAVYAYGGGMNYVPVPGSDAPRSQQEVDCQ